VPALLRESTYFSHAGKRCLKYLGNSAPKLPVCFYSMLFSDSGSNSNNWYNSWYAFRNQHWQKQSL